MRQILLLHSEVVLGMLFPETSGTPTLTSTLHSPFLVGMGDIGKVAPATFLCSSAMGNKKHGRLGPVLSYFFAAKWKCK